MANRPQVTEFPGNSLWCWVANCHQRALQLLPSMKKDINQTSKKHNVRVKLRAAPSFWKLRASITENCVGFDWDETNKVLQELRKGSKDFKNP